MTCTTDELETSEEVAASIAGERLVGVAKTLDLAFREAHASIAYEELEDFTTADLDRLEKFLHVIAETVLGPGTGEWGPVTEIALRLERPAHEFAMTLMQLVETHESIRVNVGREPAVAPPAGARIADTLQRAKALATDALLQRHPTSRAIRHAVVAVQLLEPDDPHGAVRAQDLARGAVHESLRYNVVFQNDPDYGPVLALYYILTRLVELHGFHREDHGWTDAPRLGRD